MRIVQGGVKLLVGRPPCSRFVCASELMSRNKWRTSFSSVQPLPNVVLTYQLAIEECQGRPTEFMAYPHDRGR